MRKTKSQVEKMSDAELTEFLSYGRQQMGLIKNEIRKVVFGEEMEHLIDVLLVALLTNSHVLVRADIGLGKTLTCNVVHWAGWHEKCSSGPI